MGVKKNLLERHWAHFKLVEIFGQYRDASGQIVIMQAARAVAEKVGKSPSYIRNVYTLRNPMTQELARRILRAYPKRKPKPKRYRAWVEVGSEGELNLLRASGLLGLRGGRVLLREAERNEDGTL